MNSKTIAVLAIVAMLLACGAVMYFESSDSNVSGYVPEEGYGSDYGGNEVYYYQGAKPSNLPDENSFSSFYEAYNAVADNGILYIASDITETSQYSNQDEMITDDNKDILITSFGEAKTWKFQGTTNITFALRLYTGHTVFENIIIEIEQESSSLGIVADRDSTITIGYNAHISSTNVALTTLCSQSGTHPES